MSLRTILRVAALSCMLLPAIASAQKAGGTMVMLVQPEPPTLAGYQVTSAPVGQIVAKIYDGLCEYDDKLAPKPSLADSWTISDDQKLITFKLHKGVTFHDGHPLTSADVKFSIQDVLSKYHPRGIQTFREVESIETPDDLTVVLKLKRPAPYIMTALSGYETPILPKHLIEGKDIKMLDLANKPIGSGPFKFVEWKRGEYIRLEKNKSYWRPNEPYLDRIIARFVPDASTRTALIEKGEVQFAGLGAVSYSDVKKLSALPSLTVSTDGNQMISNVTEFTLNTQKPPLNDVRVRQAISYAVDRKFMADNVFFGFAKPATGPLSANFAPTGFYTDKVKNYAVPDRIAIANKLLDDAGLPRKDGGVRFELVHDVLPYGEEWRRMGEALQQQLGQVGIKVTLRNEDVPSWLRRVYTSFDYDIASNHLFNLSDPAIGIHRGLHSNAIKPGTAFLNGSRWSSPETDALMDEATNEPDHAKRAELYHKLLQAVAEQVPNIYVFDLNYPTVMSAKLHDAISSPLGVYGPFNKAWLDK